ncbi:MAG: formate/nitrite transporter family protein [Andreesenia angusta]|nr:formate/nitrite transporter family protein [Andreesenia angusta]
MNNRIILFPSEIASNTIDSGVRKGNYRFYKLIPLGLLAGIFISIGALASTVIKTIFPPSEAHMASLFGALFFTIGIVLVVIAGGELFTGNMLMFMAVLDGKLILKKLLRNWIVIYILNFLGGLLVVFISLKSGVFTNELLDVLSDISQSKIDLTFSSAIYRGIGCNILVCLSVWICTSANDTTGKVVASSFPVTVFILLGYEHCIANMFFFSAARAAGSDISLLEAFTKNIFPVTIGNILGGVLVALLYYFSYVYREER